MRNHNYLEENEYISNAYNSAKELTKGIKTPFYILSIIHYAFFTCIKLLGIVLLLLFGVAWLTITTNKNYEPIQISFSTTSYSTYTLMIAVITIMLVLHIINWYISSFLSFIALRRVMNMPVEYFETWKIFFKASFKLLGLYLINLIPCFLLALLWILIFWMKWITIENNIIMIFITCFMILILLFYFMSATVNIISVPLILTTNCSIYSAFKQSLSTIKKYRHLYMRFYAASRRSWTINFIPMLYMMRAILFKDIFKLNDQSQV